MFRLAIRAIPNVTLTVTHVIPRLHSDTLVAAVESAMKKKKLDLRTGTDELLRRLHVITTLRLAFVLILDRRELCSYLPNSNPDSNLVRTSIVPLPPNVHILTPTTMAGAQGSRRHFLCRCAYLSTVQPYCHPHTLTLIRTKGWPTSLRHF